MYFFIIILNKSRISCSTQICSFILRLRGFSFCCCPHFLSTLTVAVNSVIQHFLHRVVHRIQLLSWWHSYNRRRNVSSWLIRNVALAVVNFTSSRLTFMNYIVYAFKWLLQLLLTFLNSKLKLLTASSVAGFKSERLKSQFI